MIGVVLLFVLVGWCALSLPAGVLLGHAIRSGHDRPARASRPALGLGPGRARFDRAASARLPQPRPVSG